MTFKEYKAIVKQDPSFKKKIYYSNFWTFNMKKYNYPIITVCKNAVSKYIVTHWLDYEYGRYLEKNGFKNRDEAINYAFEMYNKKEEHMVEFFEKLTNKKL